MRTCAVTLAANTLAVGDRIATACLPRHCKSDTQTNHFWLHMCIKNGAPAANFTFTTLPWPMLAVSKVFFYSNDKLHKLRSLLHNACAERCLLRVRKKSRKLNENDPTWFTGIPTSILNINKQTAPVNFHQYFARCCVRLDSVKNWKRLHEYMIDGHVPLLLQHHLVQIRTK